MLVQVRLVGDTQEELEQIVNELRGHYPDRLSGFNSIERGRRGGWLSYGELLSKRAITKVVPIDPTTGEILGEIEPD